MTGEAVDGERNRRRGRITFLGLVVAGGLLALLAGVRIPGLSRVRKLRRGDDTAERMDRLERAIRAYAEDVFALPPDLDALFLPPPGVVGWCGPYLADDFDQAPPDVVSSSTDDGFGEPFEYTLLSPLRARVRASGANLAAGDADDFARTLNVVPELREETLRRLRILNALAAKYNADRGGPITSDFGLVRSALLAAGYLNDDPRYEQDAFGNAYLVTETDAPAIRITSPVFVYTTNDPAAPLPPAPQCP